MASATPNLVGSEPKTPLWLTCLGGGLFLLVGLFMVFRSPPIPREKPAAPIAATSAAPAPSAGRPGITPPGGNPMKLDPAAVKRLGDRIKPGAPGGGAAPPPGGH